MPPPLTKPSEHRTNRLKHWLWAVMGAMTFSVILYSELPFVFSKLPYPHNNNEQLQVHSVLFLIIPHIIAGTLALLLGPLQFSSRIRHRNLKLHRILGRVYVYSVFIAAPLGILLSLAGHFPQRNLFIIAICVQSSTWMITTAAAFITARNRQIQQHREWMVRSYAVTFTFIGTRILQPIPAWNHVGRSGLPMAIVIITFMAILIPDVALHWRELTTRRD